MQNMLLNEAIEKYYGLNREDIYAVNENEYHHKGRDEVVS